MVQALDKRGATPRTLLKIVLMLGFVLVGVAALAAEPEPQPADTDTTTADAACARSTFEFGGRVTENGEATDTWTLTCWRAPAPEASVATAPPVRSIQAMPVATVPACQPGCVPASSRF
jgi:hypothetical protein